MIAAEIIRKKRDGGELTAAEIRWFIESFVRTEVTDYQMSALAMAICIRDMTVEETVALTECMLDSGARLCGPLPQGDVPWVDKHSTGGLGDKVSLILAPALAALGFKVPMISGRGLGITGGTLDKLEAIPGFRTNLSIVEIETQLDSVGCVICGASEELAPADRRLYALRDVTATVESVPLITASILSKKLAESISSLVLDVKVGSGTFMKTNDEARRLADRLVAVGERLGVQTHAFLSDMNQPLGRMVGNALEVAESIDVLQGGGPADVRQLTARLGGRLLLSERQAISDQAGSDAIEETLDNGSAWNKFQEMVAAQGGAAPEHSAEMIQGTQLHSVEASSAGRVSGVDGQAIGLAMIQLGGARRVAGQSIDPDVGIEMQVKLKDDVQVGQPLMTVHARSDQIELRELLVSLRAAVRIG